MNPVHISATAEDLAGNQGLGRYVLLPGSNGRARQIAGHFDQVTVREHSRGHDCHLGQLRLEGGGMVDVAVVATGMGCSSMEIILHELYTLGARRFLRVGTAGSMQPGQVKRGDLVSATASVRDEKTTMDYAPREIPAIASNGMVWMIREAAKKLGLDQKLHEGIVHCKASFYARQFGKGSLAPENQRYKEILADCGVLATEMETAALFIQTSIYQQACRAESGHSVRPYVMSGAILGIVSAPSEKFMTAEEQTDTIDAGILLALETLKLLAVHERR